LFCNETKLAQMEEERTDEMEVAEKKDEEGKKKENEGLGMILRKI